MLGLGRFGGGVGVTRWLVGQGARVRVTDSADATSLSESLQRLEGLDVELQLGGHPLSLLDGATHVVINPAIDPARSEFVAEARRRDLTLTSEIGLFIERCPGTLVTVTGSVGKSTTAAMIADILRTDADHRVWLGGNIGGSLLEYVGEMRQSDRIVLELSSYQLEMLGALNWRPHVSVITPLIEHHLDRHGTLEQYIGCKLNMVRGQRPQDVVVLHSQAAQLLEELTLSCGAAHRVIVTEAHHLRGRLRVVGDHQLENAAMALAASAALALPEHLADAALERFSGLPHRLEVIGSFQGVTFINDSKATTPEASCRALEAMGSRVVLLAGGADGGSHLEEWSQHIGQRARAVICFGKSRDRISAAIQSASEVSDLRLERVEGLEEGVELARSIGRRDDVVLLSPGCASYDAYPNYEHRGNHFRRIVESWSAESVQ